MTKYEFYSVKIPPDKQIGAHFQTTWELSFVRVGSGISIIGGDENRFARGDLVLVPPGIQHQWIFDTSDTDEQGCIQNISVMFSREFVESVTAAFPELEKSLSAIKDSGNTLYTYGGKTGDAIKRQLVDMMGMSPLEFRHASGGMRSSGEAVADGCETSVPLRVIALSEGNGG